MPIRYEASVRLSIRTFGILELSTNQQVSSFDAQIIFAKYFSKRGQNFNSYTEWSYYANLPLNNFKVCIYVIIKCS